MTTTPSPTTSPGLEAAFARRDVTPQTPTQLVGYPHVKRIFTGVHDPLYASAVVLRQGASTVAVVSFDLIFVDPEWTRECRGHITRATGIPAENILLHATHTHSGPITLDFLSFKADLVVPLPDPEYLAFVRDQAVAAVSEAWKNLQPCEAAWTTADVKGLAGGNRLSENGAEDPEAGLLMVRRLGDQAPVAVLTVYSMHPTVLHEDSTLISGDFIAYARQAIEKTFPGVGVVYLNGTAGNQSPRRVVREQTFAEADRLGTALGTRMAGALGQIPEFSANFRVEARSEKIPLQGKKFPPLEEAQAELDRAEQAFERLKAESAGHALVRTAECTVFGAEKFVLWSRAEESGEAEAARQKYRQGEVQVLRLGSCLLAGWPGEFFVEFGLEAKSRAKSPLFVSTYCNGELHGYIVTPEAEKSGGYEAQNSLFPASVGTQFVEATLRLADALA
ncbi:MAG: neutral/alkaline non-lysosomal ceramidase N-terminal domain-containing protein [Chthoniobacterales bacterium]|nr:neutral/alkaline non-lysosomal ceramidase N-terminal domain-containing protein [Chthoniobacterales bacterium]